MNFRCVPSAIRDHPVWVELHIATGSNVPEAFIFKWTKAMYQAKELGRDLIRFYDLKT